MKETNKLYFVKCKGMTISSTGTAHGLSYVVAKDSAEAYRKVREYLDDNDLGFDRDRELSSVRLVAEDADYPDCGTKLFM